MQVIYAAPFVLIAGMGFLVCLSIPRLRKHSLQILFAPLAFGVCSIVGFVLSVVAMAYVTERLHIEVPPPLGFILLIPVYVACGIAGAWLTLRIVNRAVSTFLNSSW